MGLLSYGELRMLLLSGKIIVTLAGCYLSGRLLWDSWYVGAIFGLVVLVWHVQAFNQLFKWRSGAFLLTSVCTYLFVVWVIERIPPTHHGLDISPIVPITIGTAMLILAHRVLLGAGAHSIVAIPAVLGIWCVMTWLFLFGPTPSPSSLQIPFQKMRCYCGS